MQKKADHLREGVQANSSSTVISFNHYIIQQKRRNSCKICPLTHDKGEGMYLQDPKINDGGCWGMLLLLEQSYGLREQLVWPSKVFIFFLKPKLVRLLRVNKKVLKYRWGGKTTCSCNNENGHKQRRPSLSPILNFNQVFHSQVSKD